MRRQIVTGLIVLMVAFTGAGVGFAGSATATGDSPAGLATADEATCAYPMTVEDATGEEVTIDEEPERIVALHPSVAQVLWDIGASERVVGMPVNQYTAYLDGHDEPENVYGDDGWPVNERIVDTDPDLVIGAGVEPDRAEALRESGLTVYALPPSASIDDIAEKTLTVGELVGACEGAEETVAWMDERIEAIEEALGDEDRPTAYYAMGGGWTPGAGTFQDEMLTVAGAENLAANAGIEGWAEMSDEMLVDEDPDWIVYGDGEDEPPVSEAAAETTAMQEDQTVAVNAQYLNQDGPRIVYAIEEMAEAFHPEAMEASDVDAEEDDGEATDDDAADDSDAFGTPGFGAIPALIALFVTGVLALRR